MSLTEASNQGLIFLIVSFFLPSKRNKKCQQQLCRSCLFSLVFSNFCLRDQQFMRTKKKIPLCSRPTFPTQKASFLIKCQIELAEKNNEIAWFLENQIGEDAAECIYRYIITSIIPTELYY